MAAGRQARLVLGSADLRDEPVTPRLLDRFFEAGGRSLDVANVYGEASRSAQSAGWLRSSGVRDELVLCAKGCDPPYCSPELFGTEVDRALRDPSASTGWTSSCTATTPPYRSPNSRPRWNAR